jgi:hypothetical protein
MSGGAGIATIHGLYGAVGAYGMVAVTSALLGQRRWLALAGGAALVLLGLWRLARRPTRASVPAGVSGRRGQPGGPGLLSNYASMVAFTAGNPQAIATFVAGFATLRLGQAQPAVAAVAVAAGSLAWWASLTGLVATIRRRMGDRTLVALRRGSGALLVGLGVVGAAVAWGLW